MNYYTFIPCPNYFFKPFEIPPRFLFQFLQMIFFVLICVALSVDFFSIECTVYLEFKTK